ncbi:hypothetical protein [Tenacibaculum sp. nBUS_03]|uniref:hypothetical protein n=1 Tax=Tenacibaculum sp. nBUS_03 TaxID=3395320 RepID=UPI003EBA9825
MKKNFIITILLLLGVSSLYGQKDSIVNFLDAKGRIVKDKNKAKSFEIISKKKLIFG